jgi:DNA invertase Pin-like site-specific DNA recombinase
MYQLISAFSEFERETIREHVRARIRNARAKGRVLGRPPAEVSCDQIWELLAVGQSMREVGTTLGISAATVCRRARTI